MTVKGTLIATLAAGYIASVAPIAAFAADEPGAPKGEKAGCKGKDGCKGKEEKPAKGKDEKAAKGDKAACKGAGGCKGHEGKKEEPKKEEAPKK